MEARKDGLPEDKGKDKEDKKDKGIKRIKG